MRIQILVPEHPSETEENKTEENHQQDTGYYIKYFQYNK